jgi:hypothetical protein
MLEVHDMANRTRTQKPRLHSFSGDLHLPAVEVRGITHRETCGPQNPRARAYVDRRVDHYYNVSLVIDGKPLKAELHLMSADGSIKADRGKFYASLDVNLDGDSSCTCPDCSGNEGVTGPETHGLTAAACWDAVIPQAEKEHPIAATSGRKRWWCFDVRAKSMGEVSDDQKGLPDYCIAWKTRIECPVHGVFVKRDIEPGV